MRTHYLAWLVLSAVAFSSAPVGRAQKAAVPIERSLQSDPPIPCYYCAEWNRAREPFRVFGNTYFVGTAGLGSVLVTSTRGHILIDGGLPQSAALIDANIRRLGFRTTDIKLIVYSHAHFDHVGGIAALQRLTGATVAASAPDQKVLEAGVPATDDPQTQYGHSFPFPIVTNLQVFADGETLRVGDLRIAAHRTPGHTPGGTSWSWRACEGTRCLAVVYADSLNPVSDDGFRFTGDASRPGIVDAFRWSIAKVAGLPCDIVLAPHPDFVRMDEKLKRRTAFGENPFVDPQGCRQYASAALSLLEARISSEHSR